jgi:hypothetical protein
MWLYQKDFLLNLDNVVYFSVEKIRQTKRLAIIAHFASGESLQIGAYPDREKAYEVFTKLLGSIQTYELEIRPVEDID